MGNFCASAAASDGARERILTWLADGAREVRWALCSLPRERWAVLPPAGLSDWPALRHARHLMLRETHLTLPAVRHVVGDGSDALPSTARLEHADAAWDPEIAVESAEDIVRSIGEARFELLQCLEAAPDEAWERPLPPAWCGARDTVGFEKAIRLDWLMLHAHQHELEHLAVIWRVALYWDRVSPTSVRGSFHDERGHALRLLPADRL